MTNIPTYCANAIFTVAGQTFTAPQAVSFINNVLTAVAATSSAKGSWKDAIMAEEKLVAQDGATVREIRSNIASMFSNAANTLNAFEITPRKPYVPLSAEKRAAANAKAKATRLARGTTSKKAKAAVTGNVTGVTITPVTQGTPGVGSSSATTSISASVGAGTAASAVAAPAAASATLVAPVAAVAPGAAIPAAAAEGVATK